jgi:glucose-6-phosphate 1-dehydrogenase
MIKAFDIVIFGGFGDLALRKLLPALYRLEMAGKLPSGSRVLLASATAGTEGKNVAAVQQWLQQQLNSNESADSHWPQFSARLQAVQLDVTVNDARWQSLADQLSLTPSHERIFFLAMPPSLFDDTCLNLAARNLITPTARIVLEKPLGHDRASALAINELVARYFPETQIFRIDHYLGKETVQNLLALRFANELFEPLWNGHHIDHVQISISEQVGLEGRKQFYDQTGALRDMLQNHLLQLLCLVAMEPPNQLQADKIRTEKLKVLQALRPLTGQDIPRYCVRGQYGQGLIAGKELPAYAQDLGHASNTETFVALKAHVDNWRWSGVPFYLRSGKRMRQRCAEIVIQFKAVRHNVFDSAVGALQPNQLVIRLQPNEGIQLMMMAKKMNQVELQLQQVPLNLNFHDTFADFSSDAYQRLLLNVLNNDLSLFAHVEESLLAWAWVDPLLAAWQRNEAPLLPYEAGSWGPDAAAALLHKDNRAWHNNGFNLNALYPVHLKPHGDERGTD